MPAQNPPASMLSLVQVPASMARGVGLGVLKTWTVVFIQEFWKPDRISFNSARALSFNSARANPTVHYDHPRTWLPRCPGSGTQVLLFCGESYVDQETNGFTSPLGGCSVHLEAISKPWLRQ